uniref:Uncharacterized protein n=1 Tax=Rhizophagus irregularis (strain DAOM 181602 / DAOM 197198 / MUCL 43194) TaxID=747089 RepID=U9TRC5_RHIID
MFTSSVTIYPVAKIIQRRSRKSSTGEDLLNSEEFDINTRIKEIALFPQQKLSLEESLFEFIRNLHMNGAISTGFRAE